MPAHRQQYPVKIVKRLELRIHGLDCAEEVSLLRRLPGDTRWRCRSATQSGQLASRQGLVAATSNTFK